MGGDCYGDLFPRSIVGDVVDSWCFGQHLLQCVSFAVDFSSHVLDCGNVSDNRMSCFIDPYRMVVDYVIKAVGILSVSYYPVFGALVQ